MLHARIEVAQVLDLYQVRAVITEFQAGADPVLWESASETFVLPDGAEEQDALSTLLTLLGLWSERTTPQ